MDVDRLAGMQCKCRRDKVMHGRWRMTGGSVRRELVLCKACERMEMTDAVAQMA